MLRRMLYLLAFIIAAQVSLRAQEAQPASPEKKEVYPIYVIRDAHLSPFDQYGEISFREELVRLDKFALEMGKQPRLIGYIISSCGLTGDREKMAERLKQAKSYLLFVAGIEEHRIITIQPSCDYGETTFELYLAPPNAFFTNSPPTVKLEAKVKTATSSEPQNLLKSKP